MTYQTRRLHTQSPKSEIGRRRWQSLRRSLAGAAVSAAAKGAGAGESAANAGSASAKKGLSGWWSNMTSSVGPSVQVHANRIASKARMKWTMPVDVKVDIFRPTYEFIEETATLIWYQLPPQAQRAAPFVASATGGGVLMYAIQGRRLHHEKERRIAAEAQVEAVRKDNRELLNRMNVYKAKSGGPRSDIEIRMASAIAELTQSAAAAADAAARAATACIIQRPSVQNSS